MFAVSSLASLGWPAPLVRHDGLERIKACRHALGTQSPLDRALQPAWDSLVQLLPRWMAPNCVTLLGFAPMLLSYGFMCASCPDLRQPVPPWLFVFFAVASLFYFVMDQLDGKQARRTGSSSPLGHMFDHGVDTAAVVPYHAFIIYGALGMGPSPMSVFTQVGVQTSFFLAQWQERYTGVCPNAGISEMSLLSSMITLVAGLAEGFSPGSLASIRRLEVGMGMDLQTLSLTALLLNGFVYLATFLVSTLRAARKQGRARGALWELVPILMLFVAGASWGEFVLVRHALTVSILTGFVFFFCTVAYMLFSMAEQGFARIQPVVVLYLALAALARVVDEDTLRPAIVGATAFVAISISGWTLRIIEQCKAHLGIFAFSLQRPQKP